MMRWPGSMLTVTVYLLVAVVMALVTLVLPATPHFRAQPLATVTREDIVEGEITRLLEQRVEQAAHGRYHSQRLLVRLRTGADAGAEVMVEHAWVEPGATALDLRPGDRVMLSRTGPDGGEPSYYVVDHVRRGQLWLLALAFCAFVAVVGGFAGLRSLLGLGLSFLVILRFIIPGILAGLDPVLISIAGASAVMCATLCLGHGVNAKTGVALLGTTMSLLLTCGLAALTIDGLRLTGLAAEGAGTVQILSQGAVDPSGLLLGAFIIGALGVLDDVTVAQASAVFELRRAGPSLSAWELFRRGMNIGRDHIASTVNTLVLAYAGASLPLLILLARQAEPVATLVSREIVAVEVVRTLVGSIGIVAAVPLTTGLAALIAVRAVHGQPRPPLGRVRPPDRTAV